MDGAWGATVHGVTGLNTTERLSTHVHMGNKKEKERKGSCM